MKTRASNILVLKKNVSFYSVSHSSLFIHSYIHKDTQVHLTCPCVQFQNPALETASNLLVLILFNQSLIIIHSFVHSYVHSYIHKDTQVQLTCPCVQFQDTAVDSVQCLGLLGQLGCEAVHLLRQTLHHHRFGPLLSIHLPWFRSADHHDHLNRGRYHQQQT